MADVPPIEVNINYINPEMRTKSWAVTMVLLTLLGFLSAHRFYTGKFWTAILQIITLGGCGIWLIIDFFLIALGAFTDKSGARLASPYPYIARYPQGKSLSVTYILLTFFGIFGVHRFYVGKIGTGLLQLLTAGGLGIWLIIDWVLILIGSFKDKYNRPLVTTW